MAQPLISIEIFYKILLPQLVFIMYLVSMRILANNLKDKLKDKPINKVFRNLFVIIILFIVYINIALSNIAITRHNTDILGLLIAAIFITVLIVRIVQNWQQANYIFKIIFEDKVLSKKILNYTGLWVFLTIISVYRVFTAYWIILGIWVVLLLIEIRVQYKHKGDIHNESNQ
jgi:hypothetical protein